jgi:hypothetical protein
VASHPDYLSSHPELYDMVFQKTQDTFSVLGSG